MDSVHHRALDFPQASKGFETMRILAATDGSAPAMRAVELAALLARKLNGSLKIINVVTESDAADEEMRKYAHSEHQETAAEAVTAFSEGKLHVASEKARSLGVQSVETASVQELEIGAVADTIIDSAHRSEADMIVLGKRGLSRLEGLIVGSVSQKVASTANCAVIVVP